jgi:hypothetical protein
LREITAFPEIKEYSYWRKLKMFNQASFDVSIVLKYFDYDYLESEYPDLLEEVEDVDPCSSDSVLGFFNKISEDFYVGFGKISVQRKEDLKKTLILALANEEFDFYKISIGTHIFLSDDEKIASGQLKCMYKVLYEHIFNERLV